MNIKSAFRIMKKNEGGFDLLDFKFERNYFIDNCFQMGCPFHVAFFERLSTFFALGIAEASKIGSIFLTLDNFRFLFSAGSENCFSLTHGFQNICLYRSSYSARKITPGMIRITHYRHGCSNTTRKCATINCIVNRPR